MSLHHLLPWYVNGTLDEAEQAAFQAHLPECAACQAEIELVQQLRGRLDAEPELLSDHPAPEIILAAVRPDQADADLAAGEGDDVRRHLAVCDSCTRESSWLQGTSVAAPGRVEGGRSAARRMPPPVSRPGWIAWGALAAAVVLVAMLAPFLRRAPATVTGLTPTAIVRSVVRGDTPGAIRVPAGAGRVQILFEVDLDDADFPARFEVSRGDGTPVFTGSITGRDNLLQGLFVPFTCARGDCPDGELEARLVPASARPPASFRFRLISAN